MNQKSVFLNFEMKKKFYNVYIQLFVFIFILVPMIYGCKANTKVDIIHVGILSGSEIFDTTIDGFKEDMTKLGYLEGETIIYDFQAASGNADVMTQIAEKFVIDKVDLIFSTTNNAVLAVKKATSGSNIPVIFTFVIAPVQTSVVESLRHPGGNITGVRNPLDIFVGKRLEFLLQITPNIEKIWVPYNPQYPTVAAVLDQLRKSAPLLGVTLFETQVKTPNDVIKTLDNYSSTDQDRFDAIIIFPDLTVQLSESWDAIISFAEFHGLPILANTPGQVQQGGLFSYLSDNVATGRQAARMADQVLQGINPSDLPVETAELFLTINIKTATGLGLVIPVEILRQADTLFR